MSHSSQSHSSKRLFRRVATGIALAAVYSVSSATLPAAITAARLRKPAPAFALADSQGALIRLSSYKGKVVLLDFWATWCGGCKIEIPWFMEFANRYKDAGLAVIGVSMDEGGWKLVKPFLEEKKVNYPVVLGDDLMGKLYGVESMPMTLLIDRNGKIASSHIGLVDKNVLENEIRTLLQDGGKEAAK